MDSDRLAAYNTLKAIVQSDAYSNIVLNFAVARNDVRNQGFVRELVYGVIKTRKLLDFYLDQLVAKGTKTVRVDLLILLEMGVYQILFMDSVPDHSACDETVKLAKNLFHGKSGFVNGVLRNFIRKYDSLRKPENIKSTAMRFSVMYSASKDLVKLLLDQYGPETTEKILKSSLETPALYIHVNTCKTDMDSIFAELKGFECKNTAVDEMLEVRGSGIINTDAFKAGEFFIQDISSANAIRHLKPEPGDILIDVCAAPGGKSFASACMMQNKGVIHDMDLHKNRISAIEKARDRLGFTIIDTDVHDAAASAPEYERTADKVICDVPCSGLGAIRRKPDIKYKKTDNIDALIDTQYKILEASAGYVKPGGKLMYSTCTINRHENEDNTERFLSEHSEFRKTDECLLLPGVENRDGLEEFDGFYYCIMERITE